jgi:hypothetical protein
MGDAAFGRFLPLFLSPILDLEVPVTFSEYVIFPECYFDHTSTMFNRQPRSSKYKNAYSFTTGYVFFCMEYALSYPIIKNILLKQYTRNREILRNLESLWLELRTGSIDGKTSVGTGASRISGI